LTGRIALIGNMNNNHFAMMRYFRDLGVDAHLFLYTNEAPHFRPQNDTWQWDQWEPYVHQLPFSNGGPDSLIVSSEAVRTALQGFDFYIGNGISPVLFRRMGRVLDLFIPYGDGVEFIIEHHTEWRRPLSTAYSYVRKRMMEVALTSSVKAIGSANLHPHSQDTYERLGLRTENIPLLAVYVEPKPDHDSLSPRLQDVIRRMTNSSVVVFSHAALIWKDLPVPHYMGGVGKRNQWLIEGFARYVRESGDSKALLCLLEYGRDIEVTKELISDLGIAAQVLWLPKSPRRELLCLLPYVDVGGSEFAGMLWGGCGWEYLASGVPMFHQLSVAGLENESLPPFFNVDSPDDICRVLMEYDRERFRAMGAQCKAWFDTHQGLALARRYVSLIDDIAAESSRRALRSVAA
jgi:hypothetical protein